MSIEKLSLPTARCIMAQCQKRVIFKICDHLPYHSMYTSTMVVSKKFINGRTILNELEHHFKLGDDQITTGTPHCLLYVNIFKVLN